MHQQKFAQLLLIKRGLRAHFLVGKALRRGRGIAVERCVFHVATAGPPTRADYFVRIRFLHDLAQHRVRIVTLWRRTAGKARYRQIKAAPEEMYRTGFADKARTEDLEHVVYGDERAPEAARIFFIVR